MKFQATYFTDESSVTAIVEAIDAQQAMDIVRYKYITAFGYHAGPFEVKAAPFEPSKHIYYKCPPDCDKPNCGICEGGLALCTICKSGEGELTTHCPGRDVGKDIRDAVFTRGLDFKDGKWTDKPVKI